MAQPPSAPTLADLPDELLEKIFAQLQQMRARVGWSRRLRAIRRAEPNDFCQLPANNRPDKKVSCVREEMLALGSVCKKWRSACFVAFLPRPWDSELVIAHPYQLTRLAPHSFGTNYACGLLKCHIVRQPQPSDGPLYSLHLETGSAAAAASRRLLSAKIMPGHDTLIFLTAKCQGRPLACMGTALFNTSYRLSFNRSCPAAASVSSQPGPKIDWGRPLAEGVAAEITYTSPVTGWLKPRRLRVTLPGAASCSLASMVASRRLPASKQLLSRGDSSSSSSFKSATYEPHEDSATSSPRPAEAQEAAGTSVSSCAAAVFEQEQGRSRDAYAEPSARSSQLLRGFLRLSARRQAREGQPSKEAAGSKQQQVRLANKAPVWNAQRKCWCLNFLGRVKLESVRNFQLTLDGRPDALVMQFGKACKDKYIMDYNPRLITAVQAFAIALTSFDRKVLL